MTKEIWINLPVKDIRKSKAFFHSIGFRFNEQHTNAESACLLIGSKDIVVMLFEESLFKSFTGHEISDTRKGSEVLLSFDAETRDEVDEMIRKAKNAGAHIFGEPSEIQGWMYGCGFADPDGHRWNMLHMDMSRME